ncbi:MAG TPA: hypothetical protein DHW22_07305, partial [Planctomycetaceae bacterium]|nr:hypothetical protein [Planctomycetaceae bacterium]
MTESSTPDKIQHVSRLSEVTLQVGVMFGVLTAVVMVTGWYDPNFFSAFSIRSVLRDTAIWSLFALGQAVVIISGGIDLSVGSLVCFLGVLTVVFSQSDLALPFPLVMLLIMLIAASIGVFHGLLICKLDLQPFLVTLCSLLTFRGLARVITQDRTMSFNPAELPILRELGAGIWWGIPVPVFVLVGVLVPLGLFMHFTVSGRYLFAIGSNIEAARFSGVRVNLLRTCAYALCSILAALAAILEAGDVGSIPPSSAGLAYEMYGITGAVLGGCAL